MLVYYAHRQCVSPYGTVLQVLVRNAPFTPVGRAYMTNEQLQLIPALLRTNLGSEIAVVNDRIVYVIREEMNESRSTGRNSGRRVRIE